MERGQGSSVLLSHTMLVAESAKFADRLGLNSVWPSCLQVHSKAGAWSTPFAKSVSDNDILEVEPLAVYLTFIER